MSPLLLIVEGGMGVQSPAPAVRLVEQREGREADEREQRRAMLEAAGLKVIQLR
jgi:hypothetical protein